MSGLINVKMMMYESMSKWWWIDVKMIKKNMILEYDIGNMANPKYMTKICLEEEKQNSCSLKTKRRIKSAKRNAKSLSQRGKNDVRTNRKTPTRKGSISQRELPNKTYSLQRFFFFSSHYKKLCKILSQEPQQNN